MFLRYMFYYRAFGYVIACMLAVLSSPVNSSAQQMPDMTPKMGTSMVDFSLNQYMIGIKESGPLGKTQFSAPNMFMLMFQQVITDCDSVRVEWMGTTDLGTTPNGGTSELLQVGDGVVNAQHPHDTPIMGLTFSEVHCLSKSGDRRVTLFFAPRGMATLGPQNFMDRLSAEGNPIAPLSHHLQDVFHIMSTVLGARFDLGKWSIEGSVFSGREQNPFVVNLDVHQPDSFGIRVERSVGEHIKLGGSFGNVLTAPANGVILGQPAQRQFAVSSWVTTDHQWKVGHLYSSHIFGRYGDNGVALNSFVSELNMRFGKLEDKRLIWRGEVLERTPGQLELHVVGDPRHPETLAKIMGGGEVQVGKKNKDVALFFGGTVGRSYIPTSFRLAYGGNPYSGELHLRIRFKKSVAWDGELPVPQSTRVTYKWIHANIIMNKCAMCHTTTMGDGDGLDGANFDTYENLKKVVTAGNPEESLLYKVLASRKMPKPDGDKKAKHLSANELSAIYDWIQSGAKDN